MFKNYGEELVLIAIYLFLEDFRFFSNLGMIFLLGINNGPFPVTISVFATYAACIKHAIFVINGYPKSLVRKFELKIRLQLKCITGFDHLIGWSPVLSLA